MSEPEPDKSQRLWTPAYTSVVLAQMAIGYAFSTFLLLPKYLATELHGTPSQIGHVGAVPGLVAGLVVPFVGGALDRVGRRPLMQLGAALCAACALLWLVVDDLGPAAFAVQVLFGLSFMMALSASSTLIADVSPSARLSQAIGTFGAANIAMNALAPSIAEPLAAHYGWPVAFWLSAAAAVAGLLLTLRIPEPARSRAHSSDSDVLQTFQVARKILPCLVAMLTCGAAFGAVFTFYQPYVLAQGATQVANFFIGFTLAAVTTRMGLGGFADRVGRRRVAICAFSAYALAVLAMTQLTADSLLIFGLAFGFAHGVFFPALSAFALEFTEPQERGRATTAMTGAFHLGNTLSLLGCGWVAEAWGYPQAFALASGIAWIGVAVLFTKTEAPTPAWTNAETEPAPATVER